MAFSDSATQANRLKLVVEIIYIYIHGCFLKWWVFPPFHTPSADPVLVGKAMVVGGFPTILGTPHIFSFSLIVLVQEKASLNG